MLALLTWQQPSGELAAGGPVARRRRQFEGAVVKVRRAMIMHAVYSEAREVPREGLSCQQPTATRPIMAGGGNNDDGIAGCFEHRP